MDASRLSGEETISLIPDTATCGTGLLIRNLGVRKSGHMNLVYLHVHRVRSNLNLGQPISFVPPQVVLLPV